MASKEPVFSESKKCGHCGNHAPMQRVATYSDTFTHTDDETGSYWQESDCYELLKCPACGKVELRTYYWNDGMDEGHEKYVTLYPSGSKFPLGLPPKIQKEYEAAIKVRSISANAYGVLMGRVLELVCEDRAAVGNTLHLKLADLASKGEIPSKLVAVAKSLKDLRNVGAHTGLGELTETEVPILENLARAILEYVYSAPHLATEAEKALAALKKRKKR